MIRELTKSAISFSWALSLLGIKQTGNLFSSGQRGRDVMTPITQVAVDQLDNSLKGVYRTGDNLQARTVDMAFACFNPANWINPSNWMRSVGGQQTAGGSRMGGQQYPAPGGQPSSSTGAPGQTGQPGGVTDSVLFWMNPLNWVNPNTWTGG